MIDLDAPRWREKLDAVKGRANPKPGTPSAAANTAEKK